MKYQILLNIFKEQIENNIITKEDILSIKSESDLQKMIEKLLL